MYTPKMVFYAEMGSFPGGSAQSSKTGRVSMRTVIPGDGFANLVPMLLGPNVHWCWRMTPAHKGTPRLEMEVTQKVDGRTHAIRTRTDDVVVTLLPHGRMRAMLYTLKMVVYAEMGSFPGGSAQSPKTGRVSMRTVLPGDGLANLVPMGLGPNVHWCWRMTPAHW